MFRAYLFGLRSVVVRQHFMGLGLELEQRQVLLLELRLVVILQCYQPLVQQQVLVLVPEQPLVVLALV